MSLVDVATKFVMLYPLDRANTEEIIKKLENFPKHYGYPLKLLNDNGSQFTSNKREEFTKKYIKHILTTSYYLSSNPIERENREIWRILRTYCSKYHITWNGYIAQTAVF